MEVVGISMVTTSTSGQYGPDYIIITLANGKKVRYDPKRLK